MRTKEPNCGIQKIEMDKTTRLERGEELVQVSRPEADEIRKRMPDVYITTVNRGKKNKRYFAEENNGVKKLLREMRPEYNMKERKHSK